MFEPALKCEHNAIFKQNYSLKLFIGFKMACICSFSLEGNLDFPDLVQKSFITLTTGLQPSLSTANKKVWSSR